MTNRDLPFFLIGTDQGFLHRPVRLTSLLKGNAERHDILVDFDGLEGHTITMKNLQNGVSTLAPYPSGGGGPDLPDIMQFRVVEERSGKSYSIPATLGAAPAAAPVAASSIFVRDVPLDEIEDTDMDELRDPNFGPDPPAFEGANETGAPVIGTLELLHWAAPTRILPAVGSTEIWRFINATPDTHPIHVHLVEFQVLDRQQYNVGEFKATRTVDFTDPSTGMPFPVMPPTPTR